MLKNIQILRQRFGVIMALLSISYLASAQWVKKADALKARSEVASVVYNGKVYVFLGFSDSTLNVESTAEVYDPGSNSWKLLSALPANKSVTHEGIVLIDDNVWLIGGRVGKNPGPLTSEIWIYNITHDSWSAGPKIIDPANGSPILWAAGGIALLGRTIHLFGGFIINGCNNDQDKYHLTLNVDDWLQNSAQAAPWKNDLAPLPVKRNHFGTVVLGGKIYALGGQFGHDCDGGLEKQFSHVYNPVTDTWTALPLLPVARSHIEGGTFAIDGKIYLVCGQATNGIDTKNVTIFDPAGNNGNGSWTDDNNLTVPASYEGISAKVINNTFIISHGGEKDSRKTRKATYTRTLSRNPVYKLKFPAECLNLNDATANSLKGRTWLFTIDGIKNYTTSSDAAWLTVTKNATGTATPNAVDIEVKANTSQLAQGNYEATITATGTGSGNNYTAATLCVNLTVQQGAEPNKYNLSVSTVGGGTVTKNPSQSSYNSGATVMLTAVPSAGQQFTGWSGSATGTSNPLAVVMDATKTISAGFQPITSSALITNLTKSSGKSYAIAQLKKDVIFYTDRTYKITSAPEVINLAPFIKTPNDDRSSKTGSLVQFNLTQPATVFIAYDPRATKLPSWLQGWQKNAFTLGINDNSLTYFDLYSKNYNAGKVSIGGNLVSPAAGAKNNYIIIAVAQPIQYSLIITNNGNGTVAKSPNKNTYLAGSIVTLTATPASGQKFTGWSGSATGNTNPLLITMDEAKSIAADFSSIEYPLTVNINGGGSVAKTPDQTSYPGGSSVTLTATAALGQQFTGWSGDITGTGNPITVPINAAKNITADFSAIEYQLTVALSGDGSVSKNPNRNTFAGGETVTLTAIPGEGMQFAGWSEDGEGTDNPLTLAMDANKTITAVFETANISDVQKKKNRFSEDRVSVSLTYKQH